MCPSLLYLRRTAVLTLLWRQSSECSACWPPAPGSVGSLGQPRAAVLFLLLGCVSSFAVQQQALHPPPPSDDPYLAHDVAQRSRQRRARHAVPPVAQWDSGRLQRSAVQQRLPGFLQRACAQSARERRESAQRQFASFCSA